MAQWITIVGAAAVFFGLQAVYWVRTNRRVTQDEVLKKRLGSVEALTTDEADGLLRRGIDDERGALKWLPFYAHLQATSFEAGDASGVPGLVLRALVFGFVGVTLALIATGMVGLAAPAFLLGALLPYAALSARVQKRRARIDEQLPEALEVMSISLRAGHSLQQTLRLTSTEIQSPLGDELRRVAEETELGRPIDEALLALSDRLRGSRAVRTFVVAVLVLRQTGGNLVEVIESIIDTLRQQSTYERKLLAMTSEGRSSARMLAMIPPIFTAMAFVTNPKYAGQLTSTSMGRMITLAAAGLYIFGLLWVRRLVDPKANA